MVQQTSVIRGLRSREVAALDVRWEVQTDELAVHVTPEPDWVFTVHGEDLAANVEEAVWLLASGPIFGNAFGDV